MVFKSSDLTLPLIIKLSISLCESFEKLSLLILLSLEIFSSLSCEKSSKPLYVNSSSIGLRFSFKFASEVLWT